MMLKRSLCAIVLFGIALTGVTAHAASIAVQVHDTFGKPVDNAVVYAEPVSGQLSSASRAPAEIEQKARAFSPLVTVVQTGTSVLFPNNDNVRHHVYSFSPAKTFELKLYSGTPSEPVNFDKPGTVVVGCNIHDRMVAYIQVVDTPFFAKTDAAGKARIEKLPAGKYRLKAWHFNQAAPQIPEQPINVAADSASATFALNLKTGK